MYEEGRKLYTEEINAAVRGARAAGRDRDRRHGPPRRRRAASASTRSSPTCSTRTATTSSRSEWTEYTGFLEEGVDACLLVGMHAMAGTPDGVHEPHRLGPARGRTSGSTTRSSARPGSTRRSAAPAARPVAARHRRRGRLPRGAGAARRRADDGRGQARASATQSARKHPAAARARADRGRRARARSQDLGAVRAVRPGPAVRDPGRVQEHDRARSELRLPPRRRARSTRARSSRARTTGGRPGGSSSSSAPAAGSRAIPSSSTSDEERLRERRVLRARADDVPVDLLAHRARDLQRRSE